MEKDDNRNLLLALVLCFGLFMLYNVLVLEPQQRAREAADLQARQNAAASAPATPGTSPAAQPGSTAPTLLNRDTVVPQQLAAGQRVPLAAPSVEGSISLRGARIDDVRLKNYYDTVADKDAKRAEGEIKLLSPEGTDRAFYATVEWRTSTSTTDTVDWLQTSTGPLSVENPLKLVYNAQALRIERTISVDQDYMFTVADTVTNISDQTIPLTYAADVRQRGLFEHTTTPVAEQGAHRGVIGVYGTDRNQQVNYHDLQQGKTVPLGKRVTGGWNALTTKYWMAAVIPDQTKTVTMLGKAIDKGGEISWQAGYEIAAYDLPAGQTISQTSRVFAGAKRVNVLERYENSEGVPSFTDAVDWSFMFFITKPFFWLLKLLDSWIGAFGLAILALTVVVKTVFFPLQYNMYKSMSKMRLIQPELKGIQERFAADPQRMRQEQAKLMQREKVNPLAGCLPLIPTMFVFWALFHVLNVTIEMRHTPFFGWIRDMSAADPTSIFNLFGLIPWEPRSVPVIGGLLGIGVWPILYGLTMFGLQSLSAPPPDKMQATIMKWIPLVFTVLFAGFAAGLVIYYVWSNIISMIQQYIIMRRTGVETELDKWLAKRMAKKTAA